MLYIDPRISKYTKQGKLLSNVNFKQLFKVLLHTHSYSQGLVVKNYLKKLLG